MAELDLIARQDLRDWIQSRLAAGEFNSVEAYLSDLVERDRDARASDEERIAALRRIVEDAERSGVSTRTIASDIRRGDDGSAEERGIHRG